MPPDLAAATFFNTTTATTTTTTEHGGDSDAPLLPPLLSPPSLLGGNGGGGGDPAVPKEKDADAPPFPRHPTLFLMRWPPALWDWALERWRRYAGLLPARVGCETPSFS